MYGDPNNLEGYGGSRSYDQLKKFADELKPICSLGARLATCSEKQRAQIDKFTGMGKDALEAYIAKSEEEIADLEAMFTAKIDKLQEKYDALEQERNGAIAAIQASGIGVARSVQFFLEENLDTSEESLDTSEESLDTLHESLDPHPVNESLDPHPLDESLDALDESLDTHPSDESLDPHPLDESLDPHPLDESLDALHESLDPHPSDESLDTLEASLDPSGELLDPLDEEGEILDPLDEEGEILEPLGENFPALQVDEKEL